MFDESTNRGLSKALGCSIRVVLEGQFCDLLFDLIELPKNQGDAETIFNCLLGSLASSGITEAVLRERLCGVTTDGASVNTDVSNGVVVRLEREFGPFLKFLCLAHKLEIAFKNAKAIDTGAQMIFKVNNQVAPDYSHSGNIAPVRALPKKLQAPFKRPTQIMEVTWVEILLWS